MDKNDWMSDVRFGVCPSLDGSGRQVNACPLEYLKRAPIKLLRVETPERSGQSRIQAQGFLNSGYLIRSNDPQNTVEHEELAETDFRLHGCGPRKSHVF